MKKDFTVLITGRENVGKSSLFNRLLGKNKAIVDDYPGVTRDKIYGDVDWLGRKFRIIDTGGILFEEADIIKNKVIKQITDIIKDVDLVLFVVDGKTGIIPEDRNIFDFVKRNNKEYAVVVNKIDTEARAQDMYEFYNLGVDMLFPVSAAHSYGLDDLLDFVIQKIPKSAASSEERRPTRISIIGKENVGKSSLFNALVKEERSIVTEIPGTTRDSIDSVVEFNGEKFIIVDTAGVKKRKRIKKKAEEYSIGRAFTNVKASDLTIHVMDAIEGIQEMDKRVLGYAYENGKGIIIAVNKWDLVKKREREKIKRKYIDYIKNNLKFLSFVPILFISAKENTGLKKLIDIVFYVENQYNFRVKTSVLNRAFREAVFKKPPSSKKGDLKIHYISQVSTAPPVFALFVNKKEKLHFAYERYIENELRRNFGFEGVPIRFKLKQKKKKEL